MAKRPARDPNVAALNVLKQVTGEHDTAKRRRARQGAAARAEKLTPEQRSEIAKKAAAARWAKPDRTDS